MDSGWSKAIRKKKRHIDGWYEIAIAMEWGISQDEFYGWKSGYDLSMALHSLCISRDDYKGALKHAKSAFECAPKWAKPLCFRYILKARIKDGDIAAIRDTMEYYANDMTVIINDTEGWIDLAMKNDDYKLVLDIVVFVNERMRLSISRKVKSTLSDFGTQSRVDMKVSLKRFLTRLSSKRGFLVDKLALQNLGRVEELAAVLSLVDEHKKNSGAKIEKLRKLLAN